MPVSRKLNECVQRVEKKKVLSHKTSNLLKDLEYDVRLLKEEICENLYEENDKGVNY
jgi:hypothetical protein